MKRCASKFLCWLMSALLCMQLLPTQALANTKSQAVEGTYGFTMTQSGSKQTTDTFIFDEGYFMQPSSADCTPLAELSAQVSLASVGWFGEPGDPFEDDTRDTGHNVRSMFESMGFQDVQTNSYYSSDTLPDSAGVAVGRRTINVGDKTYTLLAIAIRSAGYKREWIGSFGIGDGNMTQGFLAARDEALRFVKKYVNNHGITNNLKVWVSGHSRGAAVANMVGGFLAGGGAAYLGKNVSIVPEDVYCYCFATPTTVKSGTPKATELSVAGARGGTYAQDTPGKAYVSAASGTLDPTDASVYGGIHTYQNEYDFIPLLPPSSWGFTRYGVSCSLDGGLVSAQDMAAELSTINAQMYDRYTNGGNSSQFKQVKPYVLDLDLNNPNLDDISFVSANGQGDKNLREFLELRAAGLAKDEPTNGDYVTRGYEDTLRSAIGVFFLTNDRVIDGGLASALKGDATLIKALLYGYLSYATNQLIAERRATTEAEACAIVLGDLLSYVYGDTVTLKKDGDFLRAVGRIVKTYENTKLVQSLLDIIIDAIPEDTLSSLGLGSKSSAQADSQVQIQSDDELPEVIIDEQVLSNDIEVEDDSLELVVDVQNSPDASTDDLDLTEEETQQLAEILGEALVNLLSKDTSSKTIPAQNDEPDIDVVVQADNNQNLKQTLAKFLKSMESSYLARLAMYSVLSNISDDAGIDFGSLSDSTAFADTLSHVLPSLLKKDDGSSYASLAEASDAMLVEGIQAIKPTIVNGAQNAYNGSYANELAGYVDTLAAHPAQLKTLLFNTLFGAKSYNFTYHVVTASTLLNNSEIFVVTHVGEQYLAWMRAVRKATDKQPSVDPTPAAVSHAITVTAEPKTGGTASADVSKAAKGTKVTLSAKAKTGYTFTGWTVISPSELAIKNNNFTMPDSDVEVCANFRANKYAVVFKANGGKGSMTKQGFTYGTKQAFSTNTFTRTGFSFAGWNTKADGSGTAYKNKQEVVNLTSKDGATITLYAQWKKNATSIPSTKVTARMQTKGWLKTAKGGAVAGKKSGKLRLEALKISLSSSKVTGGIEYRSHLQNKDWESAWVRNGKVSGSKKKSQRLDAVQIRLYGKMKKKYDVYYRVRVPGYGWMGWAKNGKKAGTTKTGRYISAIQVVLVKKGAKAPAKTFKGVTRSYAKAFVEE